MSDILNVRDRFLSILNVSLNQVEIDSLHTSCWFDVSFGSQVCTVDIGIQPKNLPTLSRFDSFIDKIVFLEDDKMQFGFLQKDQVIRLHYIITGFSRRKNIWSDTKHSPSRLHPGTIDGNFTAIGFYGEQPNMSYHYGSAWI